MIDDEGNIIDENLVHISQYENEYNEVISIMSKICRYIVLNNNPKNIEKKIHIDDVEIISLMPRIITLCKDFDK